MGFVVIGLTACSGKGVDRKQDYSLNIDQQFEIAQKFVAEATPEQKNIYGYSNIGGVAEAMAKKNPEEFKRINNRSIRENLIWILEKKQAVLNADINAINKFNQESPLKVENARIDSMECVDGSPQACKSMRYKGTILLRNVGDTDVKIIEYQEALALDGKVFEHADVYSHTSYFDTYESKGAAKAIQIDSRLGIYDKQDTETVSHILELYKAGNVAGFALSFTPKLMIKSSANENEGFDSKGGFVQSVQLDNKSMETYKAELAEISGYLAVLKK